MAFGPFSLVEIVSGKDLQNMSSIKLFGEVRLINA